MARTKAALGVPKGLGKIAIAASFVVAAALPAHAKDQGNYVSIGGGYTIQDDSAFTRLIDMKAAFDDGYAVRAALGHDWGMIRLEGEIAHRFNRANAITVTTAAGLPGVVSGPATGNAEATSYMMNLLWDMDFGGKVTPYLGVGAGLGHIKLSNITAGGPIAGPTSDDTFAMQGIAGLAYALSDRVDLTLDYRYFFAVNDITAQDALGRPFKAEYGNHAIMAGLTFRFGGKAAPAPIPAAQPAPPPPPPPAEAAPPPPAPAPEAEKPAPQTFIVFFDFNSSTVTDQGRQVIDQAVTAANQNSNVMLVVTGHADRAGTESYNMALSLRRARAVHDVLVTRGIDDSKITVMAKGEDDPLVPTPDGVREPQNRRVEIVVQ